MDDKRAPRNTAAEIQTDATGLLGLAMLMGNPSGAIEWQEAEGQRDFVGSDTLPTDIHGGGRAALEQAGFRFLGPVDGDPMFQYVEFPKGWTKKATDHSMWSDLIDPKGRKRGGIFYKAAFYDRSAHMSLCCRFSYGRNYNDNAKPFEIQDCGKAIHTIPPESAASMKSWDIADAQRDAAIAWLNENYPDWANPAAYWD